MLVNKKVSGVIDPTLAISEHKTLSLQETENEASGTSDDSISFLKGK